MNIIPQQIRKSNPSNFPKEISGLARFFGVRIYKEKTGRERKKPKDPGWQLPDNQKPLSELQQEELIGFDICGHGQGTDYICFDFDHCLDPEGKFTSEKAEETYQEILSRMGETYTETSLSGTGLHIFGKPTPGRFKEITTAKEYLIFFGDNKKTSAGYRGQLETFYLSRARYILMTGVPFRDQSAKIAGEDQTDAAVEWVLETAAGKQKQKKKTRKPEAAGPLVPAMDDPAADNPDPFQAASDALIELAEKTHSKDLKSKQARGLYPPESYRAQAMMDCIPPEEQEYEDWLHIGMILKVNDVPFEVWDAWNEKDADRYPGKAANKKKWDSFSEGSSNRAKVNMGTLCNMAKSYGYREKDMLKKWKKENPPPADEAAELFPTKKKSAFHWEWTETRINWRGEVIPITCSWKNVLQVLNAEGISARYNRLRREIRMEGGGLSWESLTLETLGSIITEIQPRCHLRGLYASREEVRNALVMICQRKAYNPVQDWLLCARRMWDGRDYIRALFETLHLTKDQELNREFLYVLFRKWMIGAAEMAFNDAGKIGAEGVLILCGPQGCGKTRFVQNLVPDPEWVTTGISIDPAVKDDVVRATQYWICELGEVGQTMRRERRDRLKQYFTAPRDVFRKAYGRESEEYPRYSTYIGTLNEEPNEGFLTDSTGSRRFWPILVDSIDPPEKRGFSLAQLWGCVMAAREAGESMRLTKEESQALAKMNLKYDKKTKEEQILQDLLDWNRPEYEWAFRTSSEICNMVGIRKEVSVRHIGRALVHISKLDPRLKCPSNHHGRGYLVPPVKIFGQDFPEED